MIKYIGFSVVFLAVAAFDKFFGSGDDYLSLIAISNIYVAASLLYADLK